MKKSLENISIEARLLFEAGKALIKIKDYLIPKGFSTPFRINRPYELESALKNYPKKKIQDYKKVLEKYGLTKESKMLAEDYTSLKRLTKNYKKDTYFAPREGFKTK